MNKIKKLMEFGLSKPNIIELDIPGSTEKALAIEVTSSNKYELWDHLKNLKSKLGLYPVVSATWGGFIVLV